MDTQDAHLESADAWVSEDYSDAAATFGDRLVLSREAAGMSQAQLAHRLGVKLQTLRNWEEDRSEPRANKLQMLAGMLNLSMVWLMTGQGDAPARGMPALEAAAVCLEELRAIRIEQGRLAERAARLERRLRSVLA